MPSYRDEYCIPSDSGLSEAKAWLAEHGSQVHPAFSLSFRYDDQRAQLTTQKRRGIDVFQSHSDRFLKALDICQKSAKKDIKDLDMGKAFSWDDVMAEYEHACLIYNAKAKGWRGLPRKWGRITGDNAPSVIPFLNFIPDGQYKSLFAGLVLIFRAADRMSTRRNLIMDTFREIPTKIYEAEKCCEIFPVDESIQHEVMELYIAILVAIMDMMEWLVETGGWKQIKALCQGPRYGRSLEEKTHDIEKQSASVQRCIERLSREAMVRTESKSGRIIELVNDTKAGTSEVQAIIQSIKIDTAVSRTAIARMEGSLAEMIRKMLETILQEDFRNREREEKRVLIKERQPHFLNIKPEEVHTHEKRGMIFEQRLRKAGLLEEPEDQSDPKVVQKNENNTRLPSSSDEIGDKENLVHVQVSSDSTIGEQKSIKILADRTDSLESKLEEAGHLIDKPKPDKPRLSAVPQLHYVGWSEFKNKLVGETTIYAIEVLVGEAKYYYQRSEEERKSKQRLNDHSNERDQPTTENKESPPIPERIRINSKPVVSIMNQIDPMNRYEDPVVLLRPFKPLIYHETRIREVFQLLKAKWGDVDKEAPTDQAAESPVTNVKSHPTATVLGGVADSSSAGCETTNNDDEQSATTNTTSSKETTTNDPNSKQDAINEDMTDSLEALRDLGCLIEFIDAELRPIADSYRGSTRQKVWFSDLWHLFKPGDFIHCPLNHKQSSDYIYSGSKSNPQKPEDKYQEVMRVACTAGGRPHLEESNENYGGAGHNSRRNAFVISSYWVDFNGTRFNSRVFVFFLLPFAGEQDTTSLQCYPLRFSPKADELKSKWKARGEAFREYTTFKYRYYTGKSLICQPDGTRAFGDEHSKHAHHIDSQVVVDFYEAFVAHPGWRTAGSKLALDDVACEGELVEDYPTFYWKDSDRKVLDYESDDEIYDDVHVDTKLMEEYIERDALLREHTQTSSAGSGEFGENHLILLPNRVFAFVMKDRRWAMLSVDGLRHVKRYVEGFNELQLPMGHKHTIRSLVNNHFVGRKTNLDDLEATYDADLVRGKGKGLIILLHGQPGVGKTSTAETVADAFGKPLFLITCGDLGLTADRLESQLSEIFNLAELWNCVLLLDEADVFLAARTNTDIKRNSLVSVFLRVLEHFTGVLFLTTNRVGAFDEAFRSRIHISLYYPPLDERRTHDIWKMNLERLTKKKKRRNESMIFNEKAIFAFAQTHYAKNLPFNATWDGRQIRNAFQTASALAEFEAHEWNRKEKARSEEPGENFVPIDPQLKVRHFQEIASASYEFDEYISETRGYTDAEMAHLESQTMDDCQPSRGLICDIKQQLLQTRDTPALKVAPTQGTNALPRSAPAVPTSSGGVRQGNVGAPTQDTPEPEVQYHRRPGDRAIKPVNRYGASTAATTSTAERSSAARSRSRVALHPSFSTTHDRERQRHEAFDQRESLYEDELEEESMYQGQHEGRSYQPTRTYGHLEDPNQRGESPRRRRGGNLQATNRNRTVIGFEEPLEDEGDEFIG